MEYSGGDESRDYRGRYATFQAEREKRDFVNILSSLVLGTRSGGGAHLIPDGRRKIWQRHWEERQTTPSRCTWKLGIRLDDLWPSKLQRSSFLSLSPCVWIQIAGVQISFHH